MLSHFDSQLLYNSNYLLSLPLSMLAQFDVNLVVLLVLLICGLLSQNAAVTIAAGVLIVINYPAK
jgi:hypothetical protein